MNAKKWLSCLFGLLILGIPFEHVKIPIFRPLARSVLRHFKETASFPVTIPGFFEKHLHFYVSDLILIAIVALTLWIMRPKLRTFFLGRHARYLTLFFFAGAVSLFFSLFQGYYIQYFQLLHFGIALLGFLAARLFFENREALIMNIFIGVALIAAFESVVGICQFLTQGPLGLHLLGEIPLDVIGGHLAVLPLTDANRKLIEFFTVLPEGRTYLIRATGTFLHPNIFAAFLATSLMVTAFLFTKIRIKIATVGLAILLALQTFALFATFSRAGVIAWLLSLFVWFGLSKRIKLYAEELKRMKYFAGLLCIGLGLTILVLLPSLMARGGFFNYTALSQGADQMRIGYQQIALNMFKDSPLFGIGYNCFTIASSDYFPITRSWVHNIFLLIGAEMGLFGLSTFLLFCFSLARSFWKSHATLLSTTLFAIFVGFLFIGLCDFYFLIVQAGKLLFFLFTGLLGGVTAQEAPLRSRYNARSSIPTSEELNPS